MRGVELTLARVDVEAPALEVGTRHPPLDAAAHRHVLPAVVARDEGSVDPGPASAQTQRVGVGTQQDVD